MAGLGVLFIGMGMMGDAMAPLQQSETFIGFMANFNNPLVGILIGAVFTAIIQSSSASVGIFTGTCKHRCDSAFECSVYLVWTKYRNLYYSSAGFYRNKGKCKENDGNPLDVQHYWYDFILGNLSDHSIYRLDCSVDTG